MWLTYSLLFVVVFSKTAYSNDDEEDLLCSIVIFREGDRTPLTLQENDPYRDKWISEGLGVLTVEGRRKTYEFGQFIFHRYKKYLLESSGISKKILSIRSAHYSQHISTAKMVLKGLIDSLPTTTQEEPIQIESKPPSVDSVMMLDSCPAYDEEVEKCKQEDESFNHVDKEEKDFYNLIEKNTNCSCNSFTDVKNCMDPLFCEASEGLGLPSWCDQECYDNMMKTMDLDWKVEVSRPKLLNLRMQPFVDDILGKIKRHVDGEEKEFKLSLFSVIGIAIPCLMKSVGVENVTPHVPKFGAAIFVDIKRVGGKVIINMFYQPSTVGELQKLSIKGCGEDCEYNKLIEILPPLLKMRRLPCGGM